MVKLFKDLIVYSIRLITKFVNFTRERCTRWKSKSYKEHYYTNLAGDKVYRRSLLRGKSYKKLCIIGLITFVGSAYLTSFLVGDMRNPQVMRLTDLDRCPACYGVSVCPELYTNQITLDHRGWFSIFNAKNIFYGYTKSNKRVVLKKLAQSWEFQEFDATLCKVWDMKPDCKPMDLTNGSNIDKKIIQLVEYNNSKLTEDVNMRLFVCPYGYSFYDFVQLVLNAKVNNKFDRLYIWTMLSLNPEPIILQVIPKSHGWPVPAYAGVCGRLEVVAYEGEPLSYLMHVEWHRKLKYARKILDAAMDFTYKHERYRFYLIDWSLDNIVANDKDEITFVDFEDIIVLDKYISPLRDLPNWYQRYSKPKSVSGKFEFQLNANCQHHVSDHNIWAACYVLADPTNPLLYPIPKHVNDTRPHFDQLLVDCLNGPDRFRTVPKLQRLMDEMLEDESIVGKSNYR